MKLYKLAYVLSLVIAFSFLGSCSNDENNRENVAVEDPDTDGDTGGGTDGDTGGDTGGDTSDLEQRFVFDENIVIENSYNTGGCEPPPCSTIDESLVGIFNNAVPDDPYFSLSEDQSELNLECQLEKGRRIEFKQISRGPLTSLAKIELEGVYYDIPDNGVTIAQVHNRGGNSNKPFFRLVLTNDYLETVIRKDPEVSSSDTSFQKEKFDFVDQASYDQSPLKINLEKSGGLVRIKVEQSNTVIIEETYAPDSTTDWVNNTGIANGFYLKAGLYNDDGPHTKNLVAGYTTVIFESGDTR